MIELNVTNLVGGNIVITTGGSAPASHPETRFTLQGGTVETYDITGTLDQQWMITNGYYNELEDAWSKTITQIDIGNTVTSIGDNVFYACSGLMNVTMPNVTSIGEQTFSGCSSLTSMTIGNSIQGIGGAAFSTFGNPIALTICKTVAEVQAMG